MSVKLVYLYDPISREYLGEYESQESPLEPGHYLIPDASTPSKPMVPDEGYLAAYRNGAWVQVKDIRGTWYDSEGVAQEVVSLLDKVDPSWTRETVKKLDYSQLRVLEYPPVTDYLDAVVKGDKEALDKYIADCKAVKEKYPKPIGN